MRCRGLESQEKAFESDRDWLDLVISRGITFVATLQSANRISSCSRILIPDSEEASFGVLDKTVEGIWQCVRSASGTENGDSDAP